MCKTTILVRKNGGMEQVSKKELKEIISQNRGLATEERRHFVREDICENGETDRLIYEVSYEEYKIWHKEYNRRMREQIHSYETEIISLDYETEEEGSFSDRIEDRSYSEAVRSEMLLRQLREELARWRTWAVEMLEVLLCYEEQEDIYTYYKKRYGMNRKAVYYRKETLETFVRKYFKED